MHRRRALNGLSLALVAFVASCAASRTRSTSTPAASASVASSGAGESSVAPESQRAAAAEHSSSTRDAEDEDSPTDLEPASGWWSKSLEASGLERRLLPQLEDGAWYACSMIAWPSFVPAYAVALVGQAGSEGDARRKEQHWWLRVSVDEDRRRSASSKDRPNAPAVSTAVELDSGSAQALLSAWESVVRRARYPKPRFIWDGDGTRNEVTSAGFDGTTYLFATQRFEGSTWSPRAGLSARIVSLVDELKSLATFEGDARDQQLARCVELARALQADAERRPW